jgi:hypothetical protein
MLRCPRTHSGRASVPQERSVCTVTTVGAHRRRFHGRPRTGHAGGDAEDGRGLQLVARLAARWGWRRRGGQTVTWAECHTAELSTGRAGIPGVYLPLTSRCRHAICGAGRCPLSRRSPGLAAGPGTCQAVGGIIAGTPEVNPGVQGRCCSDAFAGGLLVSPGLRESRLARLHRSALQALRRELRRRNGPGLPAG